MIPMLRELYNHLAWADATIMKAAREHAGAAEDEELRRVLHHIVVVERAYLAILWGWPFDREKEGKPPETFEELEARFREAHAETLARVGTLEEGELARVIHMPYFQDLRITVAQGLTQVVMHSQGHRAQAATRLRVLGGKPPILDYILWVKDRPQPAW